MTEQLIKFESANEFRKHVYYRSNRTLTLIEVGLNLTRKHM